MGVFDYTLLLLTVIALAATGDHIWVHHIRPILAPMRGWPDLKPDELIPAYGWLYALAAAALLIAVSVIGTAAGF